MRPTSPSGSSAPRPRPPTRWRGPARGGFGRPAAALDPLAKADLGWLSRQAQGLVAELRGPGAAYVFQFWGVRFMLGLAEAGFYPGVIVYLTHWFPRRDRSRALAWFFIRTPTAQMIGPPISRWLMAI